MHTLKYVNTCLLKIFNNHMINLTDARAETYRNEKVNTKYSQTKFRYFKQI